MSGERIDRAHGQAWPSDQASRGAATRDAAPDVRRAAQSASPTNGAARRGADGGWLARRASTRRPRRAGPRPATTNGPKAPAGTTSRPARPEAGAAKRPQAPRAGSRAGTKAPQRPRPPAPSAKGSPSASARPPSAAPRAQPKPRPQTAAPRRAPAAPAAPRTPTGPPASKPPPAETATAREQAAPRAERRDQPTRADAARARIEAQLQAAGVPWKGFDLLRRASLEPSAFRGDDEACLHAAPSAMAARLAELRPGEPLVLVSSDRQRKYWLAVRDESGVRLADVRSKEAEELRRLSAARTDLGYLGAAVKRDGDGLRVEATPPASAAASLGVVQGELLAPASSGTTPSFLPTRLADAGPSARTSGDPSIPESELDLRRRTEGVAIPAGHWLTSMGGGAAGVRPGSLLTGATLGGRPAWALGQDLAALDDAAARARATREPLVLELVTERGLEQRTLSAQPDGGWMEAEPPRVAVTLSKGAPAGSEIASIIHFGAPVGFAVGSAVSFEGSPSLATGPASHAPRPDGADAPLDTPPGAEVDAADDATYRGHIASALTVIEEDPQLSAAEVRAREQAARKALDEIRAFARSARQGSPARSEREASERRVRAEAEALVAETRRDGTVLGERHVAEARFELARAYVGAVRDVASLAHLSVAEREGRIGQLQGKLLAELWDTAGRPETPRGGELDAIVREIVTGSPGDTAGPAEEAPADPSVSAALEERLTRSVAVLEGALDAWEAARRSGRAEQDLAYPDVFLRSETVAPDLSEDATIDRRAQLAEALGAEAERLASGPMALSDTRTREAMLWLGQLLTAVRAESILEAEALSLVRTHRRLGPELLGLSAGAGAPATPPAAPAPSSSASERRFAGPDELERFLEAVRVAEQVHLYTADRRQRLLLTKQAPPFERDGRQYAATWSVHRVVEGPPSSAR